MINRINAHWFNTLRHSRYPYRDIQCLADNVENEIGCKSGRLFQIMFSYLVEAQFDNQSPAVLFETEWHYAGYQAEPLCIHLSHRKGPNTLTVDYDFLTQLYTEDEISLFHACLMNILDDALLFPEKSIYNLSMLSPAEWDQIIYSFNKTEKEIEDTDLWEMFERTARQCPARTALIYQDRQIRFETLVAMAENLCAVVQAMCKESNPLVAILMQREPNLIAAMLGVLRAGGAFLNISPDQPIRRIHEIITHSGAAAVITTEMEFERAALGDLNIPLIHCEQAVCLDKDRAAVQKAGYPVKTKPDDLAYVIYTSGSTGVPKGADITRRGLLNYILAMSPVAGSGDTMSMCSIGFDMFLIETIVPIFNGKTVVLPQNEALESPAALSKLITDHQIRLMTLTPSRLTAYLHEQEYDFYIGQIWQENAYIQSKFLAEAAILEEIRTGFPARIYRLGRLVGRSRDGMFQKNYETNAFWRTLRAIDAVRALPVSLASMPVEMTPIDYCADAAVTLRNTDRPVLHLLGPRSFTLEEVVLAVSTAVSVVDDDDFENLVSAYTKNDETGILLPLREFWQRSITEPVNIEVNMEKTLEMLKGLGFSAEIAEPKHLLSDFRFEYTAGENILQALIE